MPNQNNFRSDVTNTTEPRFTASRIVRTSDDFILNEEVPASFAFDNEDVIELHFYTIPGNQRVLSTVVKIEDAMLKSHIVTYADNTYKNYIRIDLTKLFVDKNLVLVPGDYRMVLNFFSDEIGTYDNRTLRFNTLSQSKTEVELAFNNTIDDVYREQNLRLLKEFIEPSFNKPDAVGLAQKIFTGAFESLQNPEVDIVEGPPEGVDFGEILTRIDLPELGQTYSNTVARIERIDQYDQFMVNVNDFIIELYNFVREEIVINGDERIQIDEYQDIIRNVIKEQIQNLAGKVDLRIVVT